MTFKEFLQKEDQSGTDKGMMGFGKASSVRKPSDGQPFAQYLGSASGQEPRGNSGGDAMGSPTTGGAGMFMKKKMRKKMKKR